MLLPLVLAFACGKEGGSETGAETSAETGATTTSETTGATAGATTGEAPTGQAPTDGSTTASPTGGVNTTGGDCVTGFLCAPDMGGDDPVACDVFAQDCMEGDKCVAYGQASNSWNSTRCVPVTGELQPGDTCSAPEGGLAGIDDCGAGAFCWDVLNNLGVCVALCGGTPDAPTCASETVCLISNDGVLNLCLPSCDPLIQDCPGDDLCLPSDNGFFCSQDASGDGGQLDDPCQGSNVCDKGLLCRNTGTASSECDPNSTGCCQPYCEYPDAVCPHDDQVCLQWYNPDELPANDPLLAVGICGIPQ